MSQVYLKKHKNVTIHREMPSNNPDTFRRLAPHPPPPPVQDSLRLQGEEWSVLKRLGQATHEPRRHLTLLKILSRIRLCRNLAGFWGGIGDPASRPPSRPTFKYGMQDYEYTPTIVRRKLGELRPGCAKADPLWAPCGIGDAWR